MTTRSWFAPRSLSRTTYDVPFIVSDRMLRLLTAECGTNSPSRPAPWRVSYRRYSCRSCKGAQSSLRARAVGCGLPRQEGDIFPEANYANASQVSKNGVDFSRLMDAFSRDLVSSQRSQIRAKGQTMKRLHALGLIASMLTTAPALAGDRPAPSASVADAFRAWHGCILTAAARLDDRISSAMDVAAAIQPLCIEKEITLTDAINKDFLDRNPGIRANMTATEWVRVREATRAYSRQQIGGFVLVLRKSSKKSPPK
jgi:hypothetical protein